MQKIQKSKNMQNKAKMRINQFFPGGLKMKKNDIKCVRPEDGATPAEPLNYHFNCIAALLMPCNVIARVIIAVS